MFIGEGPGFHEDKQGEPFVGAAGQLLNRMLGEIGLTREQVYIGNIVKCRPPGNRDPRPDEIEACTPWLVEQISLIQPRVVVTLGNFATKFVLNTETGITRLRGQVHDWHGRTVIPTFHPAAILHGGGEKSRQFQLLLEDFRLVRVHAGLHVATRTRPRSCRCGRRCHGASSGRDRAPRQRGRGGRRRPDGAVLTMRVDVRTSSADETREVGEAIASLLRARDAVVLTGELGAGQDDVRAGRRSGTGHRGAGVVADVHPREGVLGHPRPGPRRRLPPRPHPGRDGSRSATSSGPARTCCSWSGATRSRSCCPTSGSASSSRPVTGAGVDDVRSIAISATGAGWAERFASLEAAVMPWVVAP